MFLWKKTLIRSFVVFAYIYGINAVIYNFKYSSSVNFLVVMHCLILETCNQMNDFTFNASAESVMIYMVIYCASVVAIVGTLLGVLVAITRDHAWAYVWEGIFFFGVVYLLFVAELYILLKNTDARAFIINLFRKKQNNKKKK